uniref:Uncharacterized protein n=1 Tax=Strongyloides papillosus TaxID=174720 RepID=A0A0N5CCN8_STREA
MLPVHDIAKINGDTYLYSEINILYQTIDFYDLYQRNIVIKLFGLNSDQLNNLRLQVYLGHFSNGISAQNMLHWVQIPHSRKQEMYNYRNEKENQ